MSSFFFSIVLIFSSFEVMFNSKLKEYFLKTLSSDFVPLMATFISSSLLYSGVHGASGLAVSWTKIIMASVFEEQFSFVTISTNADMFVSSEHIHTSEEIVNEKS